jgi:hypothetical protein
MTMLTSGRWRFFAIRAEARSSAASLAISASLMPKGVSA